jgi:hypothetical protein
MYFMKNQFIKIPLLILFILGLNLSFAQEPPVYKTIFKNRGKVSGYGTLLQELSFSTNPSSKIGMFYSVGLEGGVLFNQSFYFGVFGISSVAPYNIGKESGLANDLMFVQGGFNTGIKLMPNKPIHLNIGVRTAYGHLQQIPEWYDGWDNIGNENYPYQSSFTLTPHASVEINFFRWMQVNFGVGYRRVLGDTNFGISNSDLSQTNIQLGVSFGGFGSCYRNSVHFNN